MATIKSYTDIEQSKKLVEILPLESADMRYEYSSREKDEIQEPIIGFSISSMNYFKDSDSFRYLPCWSLAALLNVLPNNKNITTTLSRGGWKIDPIEYIDNWWCEYEDDNHTNDFTVSADNPVDACVEMILKLKEKNLI